MTPPDTLLPNWTRTGTLEELSAELSTPEFTMVVSGPGWVITQTDTALILGPICDKSYELHVWNRPDMRCEFEKIIHLPQNCCSYVEFHSPL